MKTRSEQRFRVNLIGADPALTERLRASLSRSPFCLSCTDCPLPSAEVDLHVAPARRAAEMLAGVPAAAALPPVIAFGPPGLVRFAFLAGAADYLRDPWLPEELAVRAAAVLGRLTSRFALPWGSLSPDGAFLETPTGTVPFTAQEAALLRVLLRGRGAPVPREALAYALWGRPAPAGSRALDAHISAVRRKIAAAASRAAAVPGAQDAADRPDAAGAADSRRIIVAVRRRGYMVR